MFIRIKMAQLTNKCSDDDLEYYIKECGDILGVSANIQNPDDPKAILHYIFQEIDKYKRQNMSWSGSFHAEDYKVVKSRRASEVSNEAIDRNNDNNSMGSNSSSVPQLPALWDVLGSPNYLTAIASISAWYSLYSYGSSLNIILPACPVNHC